MKKFVTLGMVVLMFLVVVGTLAIPRIATTQAANAAKAKATATKTRPVKKPTSTPTKTPPKATPTKAPVKPTPTNTPAKPTPTPTTAPSAPTAPPNNTTVQATIYDAKELPQGEEKQAYALFKLWVPANTPVLYGVIAWGPWCNGDGFGDGVPGTDWQQLANKYHLAVVSQGFYHREGTRNCNEMYVQYGSGDALLRALNQFATIANHPELKTTPLIVAGMSVTGGWAADMARKYPQRTALCFSRSGPNGVTTPSIPVPSATGVPVLLSYGEGDSMSFGNKDLFYNQRGKYKDPWSLVVTLNDGHTWKGSTTTFMDMYIDAVLPWRLDMSKPGVLKTIDTLNDGWLFNNTTYEYAPASQYKGDKLQASWAPSEAFAAAMKKMILTKSV